MKASSMDIISTEDKDFIRLLTAMPAELKFLAKGFILGINISEADRLHCGDRAGA